MAENNQFIDDWIQRVIKVSNTHELLGILAEFRKHNWTDLERQKLSHTYMRVLENKFKNELGEI